MEPPEPPGEQFDLPCWEHEDIELNFPAKQAEAARVHCKSTFYFDGACASKACAGGVIAR